MAHCRSNSCDGEIELGFDQLGGTATCPVCGAVYEVEYDETWDGEDEHCYFWLGPEIKPAD